MFCKECGGEVKPTDRFCMRCGEPNADANVAFDASNPNADRTAGFPLDSPSLKTGFGGGQSVIAGRLKLLLEWLLARKKVTFICGVLLVVILVFTLSRSFMTEGRSGVGIGFTKGIGQMGKWEAFFNNGEQFSMPEMYLTNKTGKRISKVYHLIGPWREGKALALKAEGDIVKKEISSVTVSYINTSGKELYSYSLSKDDFSEIRSQYYSDWSEGIDALSFCENRAAIFRDGLYGFIDEKGKEVVPARYERVSPFKDGLAEVRRDNNWGYIDARGKEVIACQYEGTWGFSEGLAAVKRDGLWGYIDAKGKEVIACQYEGTGTGGFSEGLAAVKRDDLWGYIDAKGKEVIACQYQKVEYFSEGLALVSDAQQSYYIDKLGRKKITLGDVADVRLSSFYLGEWWLLSGKERPTYFLETRGCFSKGVAIIAKRNKEGDAKCVLINKEGKALSAEYDLMLPFMGDYARVARKLKKDNGYEFLNFSWGYINRRGEEVIPCRYLYAFPFSEGRALVAERSGDDVQLKYINSKGDVLLSK